MTRKAKTITVENDVWLKVKAQAKKENRALSNFIETILMKYFEDNQTETLESKK